MNKVMAFRHSYNTMQCILLLQLIVLKPDFYHIFVSELSNLALFNPYKYMVSFYNMRILSICKNSVLYYNT